MPPSCATGSWPAPASQGQRLQGMRLRHGPGAEHGIGSGAYVLADRGTWLNFKNRADLAVLVEGDSACSTSMA
jgi:tungstate transport system substrate-binding protein